MTTIYVVTDGDYSDYHIKCVCSTKESAEKAIEQYCCGSIEEFELDSFPRLPQGLWAYQIKMDIAGNVESVEQISVEQEYTLRDDRQGEPYGDKENKWYCYSALAEDAAHAVKIANERRTQLKAEGKIPITWDEWRIR